MNTDIRKKAKHDFKKNIEILNLSHLKEEGIV